MLTSSSSPSTASIDMGVCTPPAEAEELSKFKAIYFSNEFPTDDLSILLRRLHNHSKQRSHVVLARFLNEATRVLRNEVSQLRTELAQLVPAFESVTTLAGETELRKGRLSQSIDGVLLCVLQLGTYIGHCELYPEDQASRQNTVLTGLGVGILVSTAVAVSTSLDDLVVAGIEVLRIAFRLGVFVGDVSQNLEAVDTESSDSWAYVVYGLTVDEAQKELDDIQAKENTPSASKIFISAISETSVTVSGPPSRLKALFRNYASFRDRKFAQLPVYGGLCHAPHIYTSQDAQAVLPFPSLAPRFKPIVPVMSSSSGEPFVASTAADLFEQVVSELMTKQIKWENVTRGVVEKVDKSYVRDVNIKVFRHSLAAQLISTALTSTITDLPVQTDDLLAWVTTDINHEEYAPGSSMQSKIAIVGMSCRMPGGATDTDKFWDLLEAGLDVHRKIPADRFDVDTHHDPTGKRVNTTHTAYGCFIDEPGLLDAPFFNMSPREAEQTDPMQRLAIVTAYEALERAGYVANRTPATNLNRIGTWYGQASDDYREVNTGQEVSTYYIPGGCRAFGPGRINYFFKFAGPSFNCDTACSSSLAAIQAACTALWAGDVDTVVAGGLNVLTNSDTFSGLCNGHFLTKTPNACKTWDSTADGYCRADGIGSIVMKRLDDALADNDNILGVIPAAATNHSANAVSITHPHAGHQSHLYKQVMARAGIDPLDVSYVEFHGTGTQAGDKEEMESITDVFAPSKGKRRTSNQPLHIGAVKANVGHGEAAAGVTAMIKVLLMLQKGAIPPHVGIKTNINPGFPKDMDKRNLHIPFKATQWSRGPDKKRIAVVNNFSAAGGNTTLVLEEGPVRERIGLDPRPSHVFTISAKSKISLKGNIQRLIAYLEKNGEVSMADLAYSLTARRCHHNHRVAITAADVGSLKQQLASKIDGIDAIKPIPPTGPPPVAFVFTGQGAADKSMNLQLYHHSPFFRGQLESLDRLGQQHGFPSFIPAIDGSFPKDHAWSPVITQVAHTSVEIALAKYFETLGIKPEVVAGHSLGEYAAFVIAGVLSASDAIFLVGSRAQMLQSLCTAGTHKMMAVKASKSEILDAVTELPYDLACVNGPKETVLCGTTEQMEAVSTPLKEKGYRVIFLDVPFAFHSTQTDPILDLFEETARKSVVFRPPMLPIVSPLLGKVVFDEKSLNAEYLRRATRGTVDFLSAMQNAQETSIVDKDTVWVEIGPHPVCVAFVKASFNPAPPTVGSFRRGEDNWTTLAQSLGQLHTAGVQVRWSEFHRPFEHSLRLLDLPTYSWNEKKHWIQYSGDWALTKGNTFYDAEKGINRQAASAPVSSLKTTTVQQIIEEKFEGSTGKVVMQSDLMQPDLLAAAHGHKMNDCGVITSSIHGDIVYTLGKYLYKKLIPNAKTVDMNITDLVVTKGLVAQRNTKAPQYFRVTATTADINAAGADLMWQNVANDGTVSEPFATCRVIYGSADTWLSSWSPLAHLVQGRIETLERLAAEGIANRFSHKMAYTLFSSSLVDYADKYRGMQAVVMNEFEAFADVTLKDVSGGGDYEVPPYFIDSVIHLAGFIMNVSDASDTANTFCVTPGWDSMRLARPLVAGQKYRSYVKMIPTEADPSVYLGDVYVFQDGVIMGMVGGMQFRRYPRILMNRFFAAPDSSVAMSYAAASSSSPAVPAPAPAPAVSRLKPTVPDITEPTAPCPAPAPTSAPTPAAPATVDSESTSGKAFILIAKEAGLDLSDLVDDAAFANIGVDSLMSLVIAEKFREELGIVVAGSFFLEYPTVGALRSWLEEYYS